MHFLIICFLFFKEIPVIQIFLTFLHCFHENFIHVSLKVSSHWDDGLFKFFIISFNFILSFFNKVFHLLEGDDKLFIDFFEFLLEFFDFLFRYWIAEFFIELEERFIVFPFRVSSVLFFRGYIERIVRTMIHKIFSNSKVNL